MENKDNSILVGTILGTLATVGLISCIVIATKNGVFDKIKDKYAEWSNLINEI